MKAIVCLLLVPIAVLLVGCRNTPPVTVDEFGFVAEGGRAVDQYFRGSDYYLDYFLWVHENGYELGAVNTADSRKAFRWFRKSANNGYYYGMIDVGECYAKGIGTEQDLDKARYWLERGLSEQNLYWNLPDWRVCLITCHTLLGQIYANEEGSLHDDEKAYVHICVACRLKKPDTKEGKEVRDMRVILKGKLSEEALMRSQRLLDAYTEKLKRYEDGHLYIRSQ